MKPEFPVAVVMQRRTAISRWADFVWEPVRVMGGEAANGSAPRELATDSTVRQWLHPGLRIVLHRDEAEGYYLNCSAPEPKVFVLWRMDEESALPLDVTASLDEAGRWLDAGHSVDGVAMTQEIFAWVGAYVEANYKPQPKKRIKPRSFVHPKDRR
jgi:Protein of unknown function (DUF3305)